MQDTITPSTEPLENRILIAARDLLAAAVGPSYIYDASAAYLVPRPQVKLLDEVGNVDAWPKTLYIVSPGDNTAQDYTQCATNFTGDFLVTAGVKFQTPELPWSPGHVPIPTVQFRMVQDIYTALHLKELFGATLKFANRNLDLEVDGWALVQAQISFEVSEVDP